MSDDGVLTVGRAVTETAGRIGDRTHARWLVETAAGLGADELDANRDTPLSERMVAHLDSMVVRYRDGEPLQYVLGHWGFRHLDVAIDGRVLIPRPETELVAETAIAAARTFTPRTILDLGTGAGVIGLSLASELPTEHTEIWLTDISEDALHVARANLAGLGSGSANVHIAHGSWYSALDNTPAANKRFDVIVSNPPYVVRGEADESVDRWEPHVALYARDGGLSEYRQIIDGAPSRLAPHGWLILEIGSGQGERVAELLADAGFAEITVKPDLAGRDRVAVGRIGEAPAVGGRAGRV